MIYSAHESKYNALLIPELGKESRIERNLLGRGQWFWWRCLNDTVSHASRVTVYNSSCSYFMCPLLPRWLYESMEMLLRNSVWRPETRARIKFPFENSLNSYGENLKSRERDFSLGRLDCSKQFMRYHYPCSAQPKGLRCYAVIF